MSDADFGKKEVETDELLPFLDARKQATGEDLAFGASGENPDFVCVRPNGDLLGVELTKVMRDPLGAFLDNVANGPMTMDPYAAAECICNAIGKKEKARQERYVRNVTETILVLQLVDGSLDSLGQYLEPLADDLPSHGFAEIWLADYTGREAYGDIELYCLFPPDSRGYYQRPNPGRKPFG